MIRHFALENELGQRWDLDSLATGFFYEPQGLGYAMEQSYNRVGTNWIRNYFRDTQTTISGTVVFGTEQPYVAFADFNAYVNGSQQLKLIYETDAGEYLKDIDVVKMDKSEINHERHTLDVAVEFLSTGLYYQNYFDRYIIQPVEGEVRWDFRWPARFNDYLNREMRVVNDGHVEAAFMAEINGYAQNPVIDITVNNVRVQHVRIPVILENGDILYYSSVDGNLFCYVVRANHSQVNLVPNLDITNKNFFKIPVGESVVEFSSDTDATNRVALTVYKYFRTV